jgi:glycosyltransferase involved in cell wall biosynthesis
LIHFWVPDWHGQKGGIQVYSSFVIAALKELRPDLGCEVFIKNDDHPAPPESIAANWRIRSAGSWPRFTRTAAYSAQIGLLGYLRQPCLVIATHLHFAPVARWLKRQKSIPYWLVAHGIEAWNIDKPSLRTALKEADQVFAVSHYTRDRLVAQGILTPKSIALLPNTLQPREFHIGPKPEYLLKRYGLTPDQPVIFTLARLAAAEQYKGYDQLLRALPQIARAVPQVRYILAGRGDDQPRIVKLIKQLGLTGRVILTGYIPDHELCDHYNLCDVFAMPSKGEGFGIVYLEALACGKPVLAGNQDGSADALCQGELGALIDPDDVEQMAESLIRILNRNYPNAMIYDAHALRQRVIEVYGYDRFRERLGCHLEQFFAQQAAPVPVGI